jgi:WD40 repeat protein
MKKSRSPQFRRSLLFGAPLLLGSVFLAGCGIQDGASAAAKRKAAVVPMIAIAVSPDGRTIACCNRDRSLSLRDFSTLKTVRTLTFGNRAPMVVRFHPRGDSLLVGYYDGTVALWDLKSSGSEPAVLGLHDSDIRCAAYSNDGRLAVTGDGVGNIILWHPTAPANGYRIHRHHTAVWSLAFSKNDRQFLSGGSEGGIRVWETASGRSLQAFEGHRGPVRSLAMSPDGKSLVSAGLDSKIRWWDLTDGRELWKVKTRGNGVVSAVLSPDGKSIAAATVFSGDIQVWNVRTRILHSTIPAHETMTTDLKFSADGTLVSCGMDGEVQTWLLPADDQPHDSPRPPAISMNVPRRSMLAVE